jgi:type II secretory pathway component PulM
VGVLSDQLDALSPRDRKLLAGMFLFFGLAFVFVVFFGMNRTLSSNAETITKKKLALLRIQGFHQRSLVAEARLEAAEEKLREYGNQPASAFLERAATQVEVREQFSVEKQGTEIDGNLQRTRYRVELNRVPIDLSLNYVYDIEVSDYPLEIESASWRIQERGGERLASVTIEIVTFALEEAG